MPIVDGLTSTKMIRSFEKSHPQSHLAPRASRNGRVPIFAVSASLLEREYLTYTNAGFDGWILKPIDFKRLNVLLQGIVEDDVRHSCLYKPGEWERGGWFHRCQPSITTASTKPSGKPPVQPPPPKEIQNIQADIPSLHSSDSGSITPKNGSFQSIGSPVQDEPPSSAFEPEDTPPANKDRPVEDVTEVLQS
jgi:CheY-like chemotaxis protein